MFSMDFKFEIASLISKELKCKKEEVIEVLEVPPESNLGDYAFPCFKFAAKLKKSPVELAKELSSKLTCKFIEKVEIKGPYLNVFLKNDLVAKEFLSEIFIKKNKYGMSDEGKGKTVVIDYSSPNIAKPFGIGHLRSTVIGNSIYKILGHRGYKCVGVNHLGDWGTQFGKLVVSYKKWGDEKKLEKDPIKHLLEVYVKFHSEAEINPELEDEARAEFKKMENGDKESLSQWEIFKELSLEEFKKYYGMMNIDFDSWDGESFYNDKMEDAIKELEKNVKTELSEGALIVNLEEYGMTPFMLRKSDGATTYHTRDLAAALYRLKKYKADELLYVVGSPQKLHFDQLFKVLELKGHSNKLVHVDFGHFKGLSTRKGNIVFLEEVLDNAIELAKKTINKKNPKLKNKDKVAEMIGIGAVVFADLSNDRIKDAVFDWDKFLNFEGETAPYVQYTHARCCSVLKKSEVKVSKNVDWNKIEDEISLVKHLGRFDYFLDQAARQYKPSILARYLLDLSSLFNSFYAKHKIIDDGNETTRILIVDCVRNVLENGLNLLGVKAPEEM